MEVQRDDVSRRVVMRERSDMRTLVAQTVEDYGLSLLRHSLSQ